MRRDFVVLGSSEGASVHANTVACIGTGRASRSSVRVYDVDDTAVGCFSADEEGTAWVLVEFISVVVALKIMNASNDQCCLNVHSIIYYCLLLFIVLMTRKTFFCFC